MIDQVKIIKMYETKVWIESDMSGGRHVMRQHEGMEPFTYCTFNYSYAHTSNSQIYADAVAMALSLGAQEPVEERRREMKWPTLAEASEVDRLNEKLAELEASRCWCHKCNDGRTVHGIPYAMTTMILCPDCGNKRCPKATDHTLPCTKSNDLGQAGSMYEAIKVKQP